MSKLTTATEHNKTFFSQHSAVALVCGATAGIGQGIAYKIASYSKEPYIVIVGRNEQRGQETLEALKKLNSSGTYVFEKCDMSVLDDIRDLVKRVSEKRQSFNLLSISSGGLSMKQRTETVDGIDERLAINYFSRLTLIKLMLPYLQAAAKDGQYVSVLSVLAAAQGDTFKLDDLGLEKDYGFMLSISQSSVLNDLMVEVCEIFQTRKI
jgi:NAD(P)-dependent dehydrogenase (short-subunit alcohol dehydrogenase family)